MDNKLCPYTTMPVDQILANREHIIPDALGGPNSYALLADVQKNSDYGRTVDASLINNPIVQMIAAKHGLSSRSGPVVANFQGQLRDGSEVDVTLGNGKAEFRHRVPVVIDPLSGQVAGVRGYGDAAENELKRVTKSLLKKGRTVIRGEATSSDGTIHSELSLNLYQTNIALTKIAYLATVRAAGDKFVKTAAAQTYRNFIDGKASRKATNKKGLRMGPFGSQVLKKFLPASDGRHHVILFLHTGRTLFTIVRLFDLDVLSRYFLITVPELPASRDGLGRVARIDSTTKKIEEFTVDLGQHAGEFDEALLRAGISR